MVGQETPPTTGRLELPHSAKFKTFRRAEVVEQGVITKRTWLCLGRIPSAERV